MGLSGDYRMSCNQAFQWCACFSATFLCLGMPQDGGNEKFPCVVSDQVLHEIEAPELARLSSPD